MEQLNLIYEAYRARVIEVDTRAERIQHMIADRAKAAFDAAFGTPSESYVCFHLAHNWNGQDWLTREQRAACRLVCYLDREQWKGKEIADRITSRLWREYAQTRY